MNHTFWIVLGIVWPVCFGLFLLFNYNAHRNTREERKQQRPFIVPDPPSSHHRRAS